MRTAEEVLSRPDFADGVERLAILAHVHAPGIDRHHRRLVAVHYKLLVTHGETTFEPARSVEHEVDAGHQALLQRVCRFVSCLRVCCLGGVEAARAAERHAETPGQRRAAVEDERGFGRTEGRRTRLHRH